jgi:hypothetical protein
MVQLREEVELSPCVAFRPDSYLIRILSSRYLLCYGRCMPGLSPLSSICPLLPPPEDNEGVWVSLNQTHHLLLIGLQKFVTPIIPLSLARVSLQKNCQQQKGRDTGARRPGADEFTS